MINFCICGHNEDTHATGWLDKSGNILLKACYGEEYSTIKKCICNEYRKDNLKYLEQKYKQSLNGNKASH